MSKANSKYKTKLKSSLWSFTANISTPISKTLNRLTRAVLVTFLYLACIGWTQAQSLAAPTNLSPSSGTLPFSNSVTLTWSPVAGATSYQVRTNDNTDTTVRYLQNTCPNSPHYVCVDGVAATSFTVPVAGGHAYEWWVHACNSLTCGNPTFGSFTVSNPVAGAPYKASFISQNVPPTMTAGRTYGVTVTMRNDGNDTWSAGAFYRLGSQNPQDNTTWGFGRVTIPQNVPPGQQVVFSFNVTAPATPSTYNFQWRLVRDGVAWFGAFTPNVAVQVSAPPVVTGLIDGSFELENVTNTNFAIYGVPCGWFSSGSTSAGWTFVDQGTIGRSGIQRNTSCWGTTAPEGQQTAYFQNLGYATTSVNLSAGKYLLKFKSANRANYGGQQQMAIRLDGTQIFEYTPTAAYNTYELQLDITSPGFHQIAFAGLVAGPDSTAFVDDVQLSAVASTLPTSALKNICRTSGGKWVWANPSYQPNPAGILSVSKAIQSCLDDYSVTHGTWIIPLGVYRLDQNLKINGGFTWRSEGTTACSTSDTTGATCAVLRAAENISGIENKNGILRATNVSGLTLDRIIVDGNRLLRGIDAFERGNEYCKVPIPPAPPQDPANPGNYKGSNILLEGITNLTVNGIVSMNAVCGSSLTIIADRATITNNKFYANGNSDIQDHWSDGLTLLQCRNCTVTDNTFTDNTDVALVFGSDKDAGVTTNRTIVSRNNFFQPNKRVFAAIGLTNFGGTQSGKFFNSQISENAIDCSATGTGKKNCLFGIDLGGTPFKPNEPEPPIFGGTIINNTVKSAHIGVMIDGVSSNWNVYGNVIANFSTGIRSYGACANQTMGAKVYWLRTDRSRGAPATFSINTNGETDYLQDTGCVANFAGI
jgi:Ig-like domain from next to BRCA1 gene